MGSDVGASEAFAHQESAELGFGHGGAEEVALSLGAAGAGDDVELRLGFHALGRRGHPQVAPKGGDRLDDREAVRPVGQIAHETLVDLELVEGEALEVAQ